MLENVDLFSGLSHRELEEVINISKRVAYNRGDIIFRQGDYAQDLYIIESGQIEISVKDILQEKKVLSILRNGDFFGEMALFDKDSVRSATAIALQNSILIVIPSKEFERLLKEKPSISFKLLGALSKRIRDSNLRLISVVQEDKKREATVIGVAAPKNGYGKTTFATTLAHILAAELPKRVLIIDLDFRLAECTFSMGVFVLRNICDLAKAMIAGNLEFPEFQSYLFKCHDRLFVLPAPNNLTDGERVTVNDFLNIVKFAKSYYDYIVIDTDSVLDDLLLNVLDIADHVFFIASTDSPQNVKSSSRFFQGLAKLYYPGNRISILINKATPNFKNESQDIFKYPVRAGLPNIDVPGDFGKTVYNVAPSSAYCNVIRSLIKSIFREDGIKAYIAEENREGNLGSFFSRFFADKKSEIQANEALEAVQHRESTDGVEPEIAEGNLSVLLNYIRTQMMYGNIEDSKLQILRILEYCQNSAVLYQILGEIYCAEEDYAQAICAFKKTLSLEPDNHIARGFLGQIVGNVSEVEQTLDLLNKKIEKNPTYPDLYNDKGKILRQAKRFDEAIQCFQKALEINPNYIDSRVNLAIALGYQKKYDEAIRELLSIEPKNIRVFYLLGKYFRASGKYYEALLAYSQVAEINGNYGKIGQKLEQLRKYFRKVNGLLEMYRGLLVKHPNFPDLHLKVGNLLLIMGKKEEAISEFQQALKLNPNYTEARESLERSIEIKDYKLQLTFNNYNNNSKKDISQTDKFLLTIKLDPVLLNCENSFITDPFLVKVRNIRTGKQLVQTMSRSAIVDGKFTLDCSVMGKFASFDIVIVQVGSPNSQRLLTGLPHSLSEAEIVQQNATITLVPDFGFYNSSADVSIPPLRYFFVNLKSAALAGTIRGDHSLYSAILVNSRTGNSCRGLPNPDDSDEIHFILTANNKENVVAENDKLSIKIIDKYNKEIFSMDFSVVHSDIEDFGKIIILDTLNSTGSTADDGNLWKATT